MHARFVYWFSLAGLSAGSSTAFAHSRWFLSGDHLPAAPPLVFDGFFAAMIAAITLFVASGFVIMRLASLNRTIARILNDEIRVPSHLAWRGLSIAFGTMLVINSLMSVFVAPDQLLGDGFAFRLVAFLQVIVGSMFMLQSRLLVASALALLLPVGCWSLFSFGHAIDYAFEIAGIAGALFVMAPILSSTDNDLWEKFRQRLPASLQGARVGRTSIEQRKHRAASVLRVMFGLQLIVLAAHDKILYPETSLAFLEKFSFVNFPAQLGVPGFTDLHFVIGAGLAEFAFGAMLIGNVATRMVSAVLAAIFVATGCIFGGEELIGHVPIVAAVFVLLVSGRADHQPVQSRRRADAYLFRTVSAACAALIAGTFLLGSPTQATNAAQSDGVSRKHS